VAVHVRRVVAHEALDRALDGRPRGGGIARIVEGDEARQALGVDRVVGRGGSHLAQRRRLDGGRELGHALAVVEAQDHAARLREPATQARRQLERGGAAGRRLQRRHAEAPEDAAAARALGDGVLARVISSSVAS